MCYIFYIDYESLNCFDDSEMFSVTCSDLACENCHVNFELYDLDMIKVINTTQVSSSPFIYSYDFVRDGCGYYEIRAFISKEGFDSSSKTTLITTKTGTLNLIIIG